MNWVFRPPHHRLPQPRLFVNVLNSPPKRASFILYGEDGTTPQASLSGLKWSQFDGLPGNMGAPKNEGTGATTDVNGLFDVILPGTTKSTGQDAWIDITDSDGSVSQTPPAKVYSGPFTVA